MNDAGLGQSWPGVVSFNRERCAATRQFAEQNFAVTRFGWNRSPQCLQKIGLTMKQVKATPQSVTSSMARPD
jgi:hypothetical protein